MKEQNEILNQILENTEEVKKVIVKPKKIKTETAQRKAENKFIRVGTKLNEEDMITFNEQLQNKNINQSQYIKTLIEKDLNKNKFCNWICNIFQ